MDPALREYILHETADEEVEVIVKLANPDVVPTGIRVVSRFGEVATCRLAVGRIADVWADAAVASLKGPRFVTVEPSPARDAAGEALPAVRTRQNYTGCQGNGVVVGVIDWGFDFTHPDFLSPEGRTRFLAIWDQTANTTAPLQPYGYGRLFAREQIDMALASPAPFRSLGYHPAAGDPDGSGAHGTHVASIAAGSGSVGEPGFAARAHLVGVHLSAGRINGRANLGDSVRILEAIDFIGKIAGNRPVAINMSVGKHGGDHQGRSLVEQGMDNFLRERPGRAIVNSTGNYYDARIHTSGRINPNGEFELPWIVDNNDRTPNELEIWYGAQDRMQIFLLPPAPAGLAFRAGLGEQAEIRIDGQLAGVLYHRRNEPNTGDNHVNIFLYRNAPRGKWAVRIVGEDVVDGRFHSWIERDSGCPGCQSRFDGLIANPNYTTGSICNGLYTIAVGAYMPGRPGRPAAPFSSAGPTADGRKKPNLLAPGYRILAARSAPAEAERSGGQLVFKSGTSMAAPHVTGAIALMFGAAGHLLPIETTRRILLSSLDEAPVTTGIDQYRYGYGYLNINSLAEAAREETRTFETPPIMTGFNHPNRIASAFEADESLSVAENENLIFIDGADENPENAEDAVSAPASEAEDHHFRYSACAGCEAGLAETAGRLLQHVAKMRPEQAVFAPEAAFQTAAPSNYQPHPNPPFNCPPPAPVVIHPVNFPDITTSPDRVVESAFLARGVTPRQFGRFRRRGGVAPLLPIAQYFGDAFSELLSQLRYSNAWLLSPKVTGNNRDARGRAEPYLAPRLLLAIPAYFRELARKTRDAAEAFALENIGWLLMEKLRGLIAQSTQANWWLPARPAFVTEFSTSAAGNRNPLIGLYIQNANLASTQVAEQEENRRQAAWQGSLAGQFWMAETGQIPGQTSGLLAYPSLINLPAAVNTQVEKQQIGLAWQQRVNSLPPVTGVTLSPDELAQRMQTRIQSLTAGQPYPAPVSGLFADASLGQVELAYHFPVRVPSRNRAHPQRQLRVLASIAPVVEALFQALYDLGWTDLIFQTGGAALFRGTRRNEGALPQRHNTAMQISNHGYGLAIDLNTVENFQTSANIPTPMHPRAAALFEAFGFRWGNCFSLPDRHHFDYVAAPPPAQPAPPAPPPPPAATAPPAPTDTSDWSERYADTAALFSAVSNPSQAKTLMIGGAAVTGPLAGFLNWQAVDAQGRNMVLFHPNPTPHRNGLNIQRTLQQINSVVLHETAGWAENPPTNSPNAAWTNGRVGTHFNILSDGTIIQYYDVARRLNHAGSHAYNDFSVGIEFMNLVWTNRPAGALTPPASMFNSSPRTVINTWYRRQRYIVPPQVQLEGLVTLLQLLDNQLSLGLNTVATWKSFNYQGNAGDFMLRQWPAAVTNAHRRQPGVYAHINIGSHSDGWFQSLYCFLRFVKTLNPGQAYLVAVELCRTAPQRGGRAGIVVASDVAIQNILQASGAAAPPAPAVPVAPAAPATPTAPPDKESAVAFNESSPQWQTVSFLLSDKRREWETGEEDTEEEKWAPSEDLPQAIANLAALRQAAGANQIRTIYDRVSNQTGLTHPGLPNNPLIGVTDDMITAAYNAHHMHQAVKPPHLLMAIWKKEGSDLHGDVLSAGASGVNAASADNAKSIFRSYSYYVEMGMDEFIHFIPVPGGDNRTSFRDGDAASHETAFTNRIARLAADGYLARNLAADINGSLAVRPLAANRYEVAPNLHFYIYSLLLMDSLFRDHEAQAARIPAVGANPDIGLTYMRWNMGGRRMEEFIRSAERRRAQPENQANGNPISLVEWAFERVPRRGQWRDPRSNAIKLRYFNEVFQLVFG